MAGDRSSTVNRSRGPLMLRQTLTVLAVVVVVVAIAVGMFLTLTAVEASVPNAVEVSFFVDVTDTNGDLNELRCHGVLQKTVHVKISYSSRQNTLVCHVVKTNKGRPRSIYDQIDDATLKIMPGDGVMIYRDFGVNDNTKFYIVPTNPKCLVQKVVKAYIGRSRQGQRLRSIEGGGSNADEQHFTKIEVAGNNRGFLFAVRESYQDDVVAVCGIQDIETPTAVKLVVTGGRRCTASADDSSSTKPTRGSNRKNFGTPGVPMTTQLDDIVSVTVSRIPDHVRRVTLIAGVEVVSPDLGKVFLPVAEGTTPYLVTHDLVTHEKLQNEVKCVQDVSTVAKKIKAAKKCVRNILRRS